MHPGTTADLFRVLLLPCPFVVMTTYMSVIRDALPFAYESRELVVRFFTR